MVSKVLVKKLLEIIDLKKRLEKIHQLIEKGDVGQTFITDTDVNKVPEILNTFNVNFNKFDILIYLNNSDFVLLFLLIFSYI